MLKKTPRQVYLELLRHTLELDERLASLTKHINVEVNVVVDTSIIVLSALSNNVDKRRFIIFSSLFLKLAKSRVPILIPSVAIDELWSILSARGIPRKELPYKIKALIEQFMGSPNNVNRVIRGIHAITEYMEGGLHFSFNIKWEPHIQIKTLRVLST